jgi:hypothetical protein
MLGVDPDGWATIVAETWEQARRIAFDRLGAAWSFLYVPAEFRYIGRDLPHGEFARYDPAIIDGRTDDGAYPVCGVCGAVGWGNFDCARCRWFMGSTLPPSTSDSAP